MSLRAVVVLLLLLLPAACRDNPPAPAKPPVIVAGRDTTHPDGRPITDLRFAAALVLESGETRLFDDIGRLVTQDMGDETPASAWVYDFDTTAPIPNGAAHFVASREMVTPRGSGLLAVATPERAEQLARETGGRVLAWTDLPDYLAEAAEAMPFAAPPSGDDTLDADRFR